MKQKIPVETERLDFNEFVLTKPVIYVKIIAVK